MKHEIPSQAQISFTVDTLTSQRPPLESIGTSARTEYAQTPFLAPGECSAVPPTRFGTISTHVCAMRLGVSRETNARMPIFELDLTDRQAQRSLASYNSRIRKNTRTTCPRRAVLIGLRRPDGSTSSNRVAGLLRSTSNLHGKCVLTLEHLVLAIRFRRALPCQFQLSQGREGSRRHLRRVPDPIRGEE